MYVVSIMLFNWYLICLIVDEQCKSNMQLEEVAAQYEKLNPGIGFKHIEFSVNDKYIATYSGNQSNQIT